MSRARNQAAAASAGKGSQLKQNEAALTLKVRGCCAPPRAGVPPSLTCQFGASQCKICCQPFICTSAEVKLKEHSDNKHPKQTFAGARRGFPAPAQAQPLHQTASRTSRRWRNKSGFM